MRKKDEDIRRKDEENAALLRRVDEMKRELEEIKRLVTEVTLTSFSEFYPHLSSYNLSLNGNRIHHKGGCSESCVFRRVMFNVCFSFLYLLSFISFLSSSLQGLHTMFVVVNSFHSQIPYFFINSLLSSLFLFAAEHSLLK